MYNEGIKNSSKGASTMPQTCRWGVLGTGRIVDKMGPAIQRAEHSEWLGVAGRTEENSRRMAEKYGVARAYPSYQALIDDPEIDAVYIALLNHLHVEWAIRAIQAGKHVLCEKPITLNAAEAKRMEEAARERGVLVMEGFLWRFYPAHQAVKQMIEEGMIGDVQLINTHFAFQLDPAISGSRLVREWGGGSLYDIGCYLISYSRYFMGEEPLSVSGQLEIDPVHEVDTRCVGTLHFSKGRAATITTAFDMAFGCYYQIWGTEGRLTSSLIHFAQPLTITVEKGGKSSVHTFEPVDQHRLQIEAFAESVLNGTPLPYGVEDAVANMQVIDALFTAHGEGRKVSVDPR